MLHKWQKYFVFEDDVDLYKKYCFLEKSMTPKDILQKHNEALQADLTTYLAWFNKDASLLAGVAEKCKEIIAFTLHSKCGKKWSANVPGKFKNSIFYYCRIANGLVSFINI